MPSPGEDADKAGPVRAMFSQIAGSYDALNRLFTAGIDLLWRREAALEVLSCGPKEVLDLATGTGDLALALARLAPELEITACDFTEAMLERARHKAERAGLAVHFLQGDALALPFGENRFDAVCCAFGFRNFADFGAALSEILRVLKPQGKLVILELSPPGRSLTSLLYREYFEQLLPVLGERLSGQAAYRYLPASVAAFPSPEALAQRMRSCGFQARYRRLSGGIAALHVGVKPEVA